MADAMVIPRVPMQSTREERIGAAARVVSLPERVVAVPSERPAPNPTSTGPDLSQPILSQLPFLRRIACRWHQRVSDRDDLVQDTLVRALANAHLWQPGSNLRAWLVTIMRNQFLASLAKSGRSEDAQRIYADTQGHSLSGDDNARLILRDVDRSLRRMPSAQRQAVLLVGLEGKSYDEVGRAMGISANAVRSHLARARQYLRESVHSGRSSSPLGSRNGTELRLASVK
ncbi:MAG TPA: RNA polymerase sigma factor [Stellaceae bacterium]|nr:RNA polymerase sigma factor [Stellaceae bacterium]